MNPNCPPRVVNIKFKGSICFLGNDIKRNDSTIKLGNTENEWSFRNAPIPDNNPRSLCNQNRFVIMTQKFRVRPNQNFTQDVDYFGSWGRQWNNCNFAGWKLTLVDSNTDIAGTTVADPPNGTIFEFIPTKVNKNNVVVSADVSQKYPLSVTVGNGFLNRCH